MRYLSGGESHGPCLSGIIDGLPAGLELNIDDINKQLGRRQIGYGRGARMAIEKDQVQILSGLRFRRTIGSPLTLQIKNRDWENWREIMAPEGFEPQDAVLQTRPRPGHADLAGGLKYNHEDLRMILERSSARETAMRVAVGSVGRILLEKFRVRFYSHIVSIGSVDTALDSSELPDLFDQIEKSPLRCADPIAEKDMRKEIDKAKNDGDTLGGIMEIVVTGLPPGLGSHVHWDLRLDGRLAGAIASIQGIKGVEIGTGFKSARLRGSQLHDPIVREDGSGIVRPSNRAGGLEGGITNGQPLILRAAMKPIPTLADPLPSIDWNTGLASHGATERSDVCAVPAAAVVAEAVAAWELAVSFREKFAGDYIEEVEAAYQFYMEQVNRRLR
ncbi:MAG: chorismate synthase [Bacillota bacterium]